MADPYHLKWLADGVTAWNQRLNEEPFVPDLSAADLKGADLRGVKLQQATLSYANLLGADLSEAELSGADLTSANLGRSYLRGAFLLGAVLDHANLRESNLNEADLSFSSLLEVDLRKASLRGTFLKGANLTGANVRTGTTSTGISGVFEPMFTDLSGAIDFTFEQLATLHGDTGVILPDGLEHPFEWHDWQRTASRVSNTENAHPSPKVHKTQVVAITSPAEFEGENEKINVALTPVNPAPRHGSSTPTNETIRDQLVKSVEEMAKALRENLEAYETEDSNRVSAAQQLAKATRTIQNQAATGGKRLLIPMFYRIVEATARAHVEDAHALEVIDREMFAGLIDMARQVYAYYPALAEANDPNNTHRVPDNPGVTSDELISRLRELFFGDETREHFTDKTRELFEAEVAATTPEGTNAEKFRIARFGALSGEVVREMRHRAERAKSELPSRELTGRWVGASMTAEAIWAKVAPFLGL